MPELPEVETIVRGLQKSGLIKKTIREAQVRWPKTVSKITAAQFAQRLRGRIITHFSRRAKYIIAQLDNGNCLLIHLRMTGQFHLEPAGTAADTHDQVVLTFEGGRQLHFHDTRKFGRFELVAALAARLPHLGPEPLTKTFTPAALQACLQKHRRIIKPVLLDQRVVAGIGNIYADESLWAAGLHPKRRADSLTLTEILRLHHAIRQVLTRAIRRGGTSLGNGATNFYSVAGRRGRNRDALKVFRRDGEACPRCGGTIQRMVVAQRGTHICPHCQPLQP